MMRKVIVQTMIVRHFNLTFMKIREPEPTRRPKRQDLETMKWTKRDNRPILHNFTGSSGIQQGDLNADKSISFICLFLSKCTYRSHNGGN